MLQFESFNCRHGGKSVHTHTHTQQRKNEIQTQCVLLLYRDVLEVLKKREDEFGVIVSGDGEGEGHVLHLKGLDGHVG